jgi:hypothetical protein
MLLLLPCKPLPVVASAEFHSIAYDPLSNIVFGGTQDNGTPIQSATGNISWNLQFGGDGGVVGIDASSGTSSFRYYSSQNFGSFTRSEWDTSGKFVRSQLVALNITAGTGMGMTLSQFDPDIQFYQPFVLNAINPARMLIGTGNVLKGTGNLYESSNRGDSLTNLGSLGAPVNSQQGYGQAMAYGSRLAGLPVPDVFYVGAGATIFHRVTAAGEITKLASYPGGTVITIVMNPISDLNNKVWGSSDEGATWVDLTGNLPSLTNLVTTIEVLSPDGTVGTTTLFAGGFGVFQLTNPSTIGGTWTPVTGPPPASIKIPPALVLDLHFDSTDKFLVAGTLGRGAWLFSNPGAIPSARRKLPSSTAAKNLPAPPPSVPNSQNVPLPPDPVSKSRR